MIKLSPTDIHFVLTRTPKYVRTMLTDNVGELFMAGGFIRATIAGEKPSDIDIFGPSREKLEAVAKDVVVNSNGGARLHETENAYTILWKNGRVPLQFIHRWVYSDAMKLVQEFDFSIAQAAVWAVRGDDLHPFKWESLCGDHFYSDLAAKRLRYLYPSRAEDAGGSLMRARKFLKRGYSIQAPSLAGIISRLMSGLNWDDGRIAEERWRAQVLTGLLREVDPMLVVDGLELADEHEFLSEDDA